MNPPRDAPSLVGMKHITFSDKSLLVGDEAADLLLEYGAVLAQRGSGDTVKLAALGIDGGEVEATFLLDSGSNLMAESTPSTLPEPDNSASIMYMRERMMRLTSPTNVVPEDQSMPDNYEDLNL